MNAIGAVLGMNVASIAHEGCDRAPPAACQLERSALQSKLGQPTPWWLQHHSSHRGGMEALHG